MTIGLIDIIRTDSKAPETSYSEALTQELIWYKIVLLAESPLAWCFFVKYKEHCTKIIRKNDISTFYNISDVSFLFLFIFISFFLFVSQLQAFSNYWCPNTLILIQRFPIYSTRTHKLCDQPSRATWKNHIGNVDHHKTI